MELPQGKKIILFDGVCNLCDRMVQYIISRDKKDVFRFVALQSELGQQITKHIGIDTQQVDSIILYEPGVAYFYKSGAALEIAREFGGIFHLGTIFKIIPAPLRNAVYDYVAKNRYNWYGKKTACLVPTPAIASKFL